MTEEKLDFLDRELARLPRVRASEDFSGRVLEAAQVRAARVRAAQTSRQSARRPILALAGAGLLATLLVLGVLLTGPDRSYPQRDTEFLSPSGRSSAAENSALEIEFQRIRREAKDLRIQLENDAALVYLGGTEQFDLVVDLERLPTGRNLPASTFSP